MRKGNKGRPFVPILAALLILVLLFSLFQILRHAVPESREAEVRTSKTVTYNGVEYFPRQDIDVLLVMGIDKFGPVEPSGAYNNDGEADTILLLIFDHTAQAVRTLSINRDTMTEMPVLGIGGKQAGTYYGQIALSHTYGSGLEDSCENTRSAVSALLGGLHIDYYVAMHMDAIGILNDAVGGVTVEVEDDFSAAGVEIPTGRTTLFGQQAIDFVRYRQGVGDQLNISRMERQLDYIEGFFDSLRSTLAKNSNIVADIYGAAAEYLVTDCSATVLSSMMERYGDYSPEAVQSIPGDNRKGAEHMEFYPREDALEQLVLELFYAPK